MLTIPANKLKIQGVSSITRAMTTENEIAISVRGKTQYVVLPVEEYHRLRQLELEAAWLQARKEVEQGQFIIESADAHVARLEAELSDAL